MTAAASVLHLLLPPPLRPLAYALTGRKGGDNAVVGLSQDGCLCI